MPKYYHGMPLGIHCIVAHHVANMAYNAVDREKSAGNK